MDKASQIALNSSKNIQRSLAYVGTAATAMAATVVAGLTEAMSKADDFAFSMARAAEITGTSADMFSKLAYSAKLTGTPIETLQGAMEKLSKTAGAARSGQKEQAAAFAAIGISAKDLDGPLKDAGDLTVAVAKKMDGYAESTNKTALEQKLFGRSGAELAPLLKQLASGFDTASEQATLFGVVVGDKTAGEAKKLHASMVQLESIGLGFSLRLLSGVAPALDTLAQKVVTFVSSSNGMRTVDSLSRTLATTVTGLGNAFEFLTEHTTAVKRTLEAVAALQAARFIVPIAMSAVKAGTSLDILGLSALTMVGRLSGVSAVLPLLTSVTTALRVQTLAIAGLAAEEGVATAATYALQTAWKSLSTAILTNPIGAALALLTAGAYVFYKALTDDVAAATKLGDAAVTVQDYWRGAIDNASDSLRSFKHLLEATSLGGIRAALDEYKSIPTFGNRVHQEANVRNMLSKYATVQTPEQMLGLPSGGKANAPALPTVPKEAAQKVDQLKLKMDELAASARAAQQMLRDAGKGVDFERANEITREYDKTVLELEAHLKTQHKALTEADKAAIRSSIATRINDESQARFRDEVVKSTEQILAQASAQDILTAAVGQGAAAMRKAQVESEFKTKYAGQSEEWMRANQALIDKQKQARYSELSAADGQKNTAALDGLRTQVSVQEALNAAILAGRDAMNQARLTAEQDAIRKQYADRGDTNGPALVAELAENERLFNAKQRESDLTRATAMDAARLYNDEAAAIRSAAQAAEEASKPLSNMAVAQAQKQAWDEYLASVDKTTLAVGSASQGVSVFFQQMARETESAAEQVHEVLGGAFESLNESLVRILSGQKANFAEFFRGISQSIARLTIKNVEQGVAGSVLGKLGIGKAPDPTVKALSTTNDLLKQILGAVSPVGADGGSGIVSAVKSASSGGSGLASATRPLLSLVPGGDFLSSLFGGHRALGGDVTAGMQYDVGEMGRETFIPTQNGRIVPNNKLGGSGLSIGHIDARGSQDPAQTEAAIHRALRQYGPSISSSAVKTVHEQSRRKPSSAGR